MSRQPKTGDFAVNWSDRLDKLISEKGLCDAVPKVSKDPFAPFDTASYGDISKKSASIPSQARHAYTFRLHNGEGGGTWLTEISTLPEARAELAKIYGDRLAVVAMAGGDGRR